MTAPTDDGKGRETRDPRQVVVAVVKKLERREVGVTRRDVMAAVDALVKRRMGSARASLVERVIEKVEGMRKPTRYPGAWATSAKAAAKMEGFNEGLDAAIAALKEMRDE